MVEHPATLTLGRRATARGRALDRRAVGGGAGRGVRDAAGRRGHAPRAGPAGRLPSGPHRPQIREHIRRMADVTMELFEELGVDGTEFRMDHPGVWRGQTKMASIGAAHQSRGLRARHVDQPRRRPELVWLAGLLWHARSPDDQRAGGRARSAPADRRARPALGARIRPARWLRARLAIARGRRQIPGAEVLLCCRFAAARRSTVMVRRSKANRSLEVLGLLWFGLGSQLGSGCRADRSRALSVSR